jgi:Rad3-related DNA helicase
VISAFYQDIQSGKGAIIFAVCRGKISEGLDFSDDAARAVVLVGIPYPLVVDPKTIMKKYYLDNKSYNAHKLSGQQWYCQQATRALNQAIGRVIRHKEDYGNIILIDQRFDSDK